MNTDSEKMIIHLKTELEIVLFYNLEHFKVYR